MAQSPCLSGSSFSKETNGSVSPCVSTLLPGARGSLGYPCADPHSRTVFRGHPATWYWCPAGSDEDSGHVVLVWHQQGMIYGVTTHGHTLFNMRLVTYIANHLVKLHGTSKTGSR